MTAEKRYRAFISYSHADRAWAEWLHKALESYNFPAQIRRSAAAANYPQRLTPIFLDRFDLAAATNIDDAIAAALRASRHLIVICSPSATRSTRVAAEIELFLGHSGNGPLCLIVAGRPDAARRGGRPEDECIPVQLRRATTVDGTVVPLAADARPGKGGRQEALLKLIAGILGVDLDQLRQRDLLRRRRRWIATSAGLTAVMLGALALASYAWSQRDAAVAAQSRLLSETAAQKLRGSDVVGAEAIILEVLKSATFDWRKNRPAIDIFQEIRGGDLQLAVLPDPGQHPVHSASYSPDGTHIVTASYDTTARTWDAHTGLPVATLAGHSGLVRWAAYSPDGTHIVTASLDGTARTWDATSGAALLTIKGHSDGLFCASYSPDGAHLVTASSDKTARIWDSHTGASLRILSGHDDVVFSAAFSPDGKHVVTGSLDRTARVWDAVTGAQLLLLKGHSANVFSVAYSPDGKRIVTGSLDTTARIWDASNGTPIAILAGHHRPIEYAAFSPDNARVVTASDDGTARIWDVASESQIAVLAGHTDGLFVANYSPDGSRIVTSSLDRTARIWDATITSPPAVLSGHRGYVYSAAYSRDGKHVVSGSFDRTARVWDTRSGQTTMVLAGHRGYVFRAAYSPDGSQIATASYDHTARIWDAATGSSLRELRGHSANVYGIAYSPDGLRIVTTSADSTARIWDAKSGATLTTLVGHHGFVDTAAFSPDGTHVATASVDKTARIWDARSGKPELVLSGHSDGLNWLAYSADGTRLVTASNDKSIRIWDTKNGQQVLAIVGHRMIVTSAVFSPDASRIVSGSEDGTVRIWNAYTGAPEAVLSGHGEPVNSVDYSPDGTHIVSASEDGTARIWAVPSPADFPMQVTWSEAAQVDALSNEALGNLGLPVPFMKWRQSPRRSTCDEAAGAFYDPDRRARGELRIEGAIAVSACSKSLTAENANSPRTTYEMGRALLAQNDISGARKLLESSAASGYAAARVDLADLLASSPNLPHDSGRVVSLYESAWNAGVGIAAFRLGQLYEHGLTGSAAMSRDSARAWLWYQKGADAGEPNALARFAAHSESLALDEQDLERRNSHLLDACEFYAAAAERARSEDWPDDAWRIWRYRRATLARLLARDGWMPQVAARVNAVRLRSAPSPWESIKVTWSVIATRNPQPVTRNRTP